MRQSIIVQPFIAIMNTYSHPVVEYSYVPVKLISVELRLHQFSILFLYLNIFSIVDYASIQHGLYFVGAPDIRYYKYLYDFHIFQYNLESIYLLPQNIQLRADIRGC